MGRRIAIVVPVFEDWESFATLLRRMGEAFADLHDVRVQVVAVDDGSLTRYDPNTIPHISGILEVAVLRLATNLGHQRAIAVGLSALAPREDIDFVIVMDGDGEDRPEDIAALRSVAAANPGNAVMARRSKRSEHGLFKVGYVLYKWLFRILTGQTINFGNFCLLPMPIVRRLVYMAELWNNLPAALIRSRVRYTALPLARGTRYAGQSRMNMAGLVVHGLSAMSVYTDVIFVRIIMLACMVSGLTVIGMVVVALIRFFSDLGVPGWASTVFGTLTVILMQTLVIVIATCLVLLAGRGQRPIVPATDSGVYVAERIGWRD